MSTTLLRPHVRAVRRSQVRPQKMSAVEMGALVQQAVARVNMFDRKDGQQIALGSCFIVDASSANTSLKEPVIATCFHCVDQIGYLQGVLPGGKKFTLEPMAVNPIADCALARIVGLEMADIKALTLPFNDAGQIEGAGKTTFVAAHGHPLGLQKEDEPCTSSRGWVSNRVPFSGPFGGVCDDVIFTDAAINPGNSGGPLTDRYGRPHGICSWGIGGADNLGFAPSIRWWVEVAQKLSPTDTAFHGFAGARVVQSPYGPMVLVAEKSSDLAPYQSSRPRPLLSRMKNSAGIFSEWFGINEADRHPELARQRKKALREHRRYARVANPQGFAIIREVNGDEVNSVSEIRDILECPRGRAKVVLERGIGAITREGKEIAVSVQTCAEPS